MAVQMDEVKKAVAEQLSHIQEALAAYEARPTKAGLRSLRFAVENTPSNVAFAAEALAEHVENTVTRAKAGTRRGAWDRGSRTGAACAGAGR